MTLEEWEMLQDVFPVERLLQMIDIRDKVIAKQAEEYGKLLGQWLDRTGEIPEGRILVLPPEGFTCQ